MAQLLVYESIVPVADTIMRMKREGFLNTWLMETLLSVGIAALVAALVLPSHGQQPIPGADPALAALLDKHAKALETPFVVSIEAQRANGITKTGRFYRGKAGGGWASRLDATTASIVVRGKSFREMTIDRPDYHLDLFELNKTGVKALYSDPLMPRSNEATMQPPKLDPGNMLRRYRAEGSTTSGAVPPKSTMIVAKEPFYGALLQQSSKEHLKLFAYRMEISWFPDKYLIRAIRHVNSDGATIATYLYSDYNFSEVSDELFALPEGYSLTEVSSKLDHVQAITKAKIDASRDEMIQAGVPAKVLEQAQAKLKQTNAKSESVKANSKLAFALVFGALVVVGVGVLLTLKLRSRTGQAND